MNAVTTGEPREGKPNTRTIILKALPRVGIAILVFAAALFLSAGRLDWPFAWVLLAMQVANSAIALWTMDPELIQERMETFKGKEGTKIWDIVLVVLMGPLGTLAIMVVSGLDVRSGWSELVLALQVAAALMIVPALLLLHWAMRTNKFFSAVVRIQRDRGHTVVTGGPYGFVRHPGYVGGIVYCLAMPVMLGSTWALIPAASVVGLIILRTALEDGTLRKELAGYAEYASRVRYRLLPGVW
jgi:protein-S-isoprenylcysteine O-methyltransferase Ste14